MGRTQAQDPVRTGARGPLTQSDVIHRYLAEKYGLLGKSALEKLRIDEAYELGNDFLNAVTYAVFVQKTEEAKALAHADLLETVMPRFLTHMKSILERNGNNGFMVGDSLSLADLQAFHLLNNFVRFLNKDALAGEWQAYLDGIRKSNAAFSTFLKEKISPICLPPYAGVGHLAKMFAGEFDN